MFCALNYWIILIQKNIKWKNIKWKKALNASKAKKATGIDGIPAWFLKQYSEDLAPVAHNIITSIV
jgi:hypothetical protein